MATTPDIVNAHYNGLTQYTKGLPSGAICLPGGRDSAILAGE